MALNVCVTRRMPYSNPSRASTSGQLGSERHDFDDVREDQQLIEQVGARVADELGSLSAGPRFRNERSFDMDPCDLFDGTRYGPHGAQHLYDF